MLFHLSLDAHHPRRAAEVVAELWGGEAMPFPAVYPGSWMALAGDERGTMIEFYPAGVQLTPGENEEDGAFGLMMPRTPTGSATHFAIATQLSAAEVRGIAEREGWLCRTCMRGGRFGVIELWIENRMLVELLTPAMQRQYLETVNVPNWRAMLAQAQLAA